MSFVDSDSDAGAPRVADLLRRYRRRRSAGLFGGQYDSFMQGRGLIPSSSSDRADAKPGLGVTVPRVTDLSGQPPLVVDRNSQADGGTGVDWAPLVRAAAGAGPTNPRRDADWAPIVRA